VTAPRSLDVVVGAVLAGPAVVTAILACGGLASADPVGMAFGGAMALGSLGIGWGAVQHLRSGIAGVRAENASRLTRQREAARGEVGHTLVRYEVDPDTWRRFWRTERLDRAAEAVGIALGLGAFGGLALASARAIGPCDAIGFASAFGIGFSALWLVWVTRGGLTASRRVEVVDDTIHIGGVAHRYRSDRHTFLGARILRDRDPPALELSVSWPTRGGTVTEEIRAPIPADRLDEVEAVLGSL
jgi:hypothetical protein